MKIGCLALPMSFIALGICIAVYWRSQDEMFTYKTDIVSARVVGLTIDRGNRGYRIHLTDGADPRLLDQDVTITLTNLSTTEFMLAGVWGNPDGRNISEMKNLRETFLYHGPLKSLSRKLAIDATERYGNPKPQARVKIYFENDQRPEDLGSLIFYETYHHPDL